MKIFLWAKLWTQFLSIIQKLALSSDNLGWKEDVQNKLNAVLQYKRQQAKPVALLQHQLKPKAMVTLASWSLILPLQSLQIYRKQKQNI